MDVARAGFHLLEEQEARLATLRATLVEGEESGLSDRTVQDIWESAKNRNGAARG